MYKLVIYIVLIISCLILIFKIVGLSIMNKRREKQNLNIIENYNYYIIEEEIDLFAIRKACKVSKVERDTRKTDKLIEVEQTEMLEYETEILQDETELLEC